MPGIFLDKSEKSEEARACLTGQNLRRHQSAPCSLSALMVAPPMLQTLFTTFDCRNDKI